MEINDWLSVGRRARFEAKKILRIFRRSEPLTLWGTTPAGPYKVDHLPHDRVEVIFDVWESPRQLDIWSYTIFAQKCWFLWWQRLRSSRVSTCLKFERGFRNGWPANDRNSKPGGWVRKSKLTADLLRRDILAIEAPAASHLLVRLDKGTLVLLGPNDNSLFQWNWLSIIPAKCQKSSSFARVLLWTKSLVLGAGTVLWVGRFVTVLAQITKFVRDWRLLEH